MDSMSSKFVPVSLDLTEVRKFQSSDLDYKAYMDLVKDKDGQMSILEKLDKIKLGRTTEMKNLFLESIFQEYIKAK